jgi:hypothetical protein
MARGADLASARRRRSVARLTRMAAVACPGLRSPKTVSTIASRWPVGSPRRAGVTAEPSGWGCLGGVPVQQAAPPPPRGRLLAHGHDSTGSRQLAQIQTPLGRNKNLSS